MKFLFAALLALPLLANATEPAKCVSPAQLLESMEKWETLDPILSAVVLADTDKWERFKAYLKAKKITASDDLMSSDSSEIYVPKKGVYASIASFKDGCLLGSEKIPLEVILMFMDEEQKRIPA